MENGRPVLSAEHRPPRPFRMIQEDPPPRPWSSSTAVPAVVPSNNNNKKKHHDGGMHPHQVCMCRSPSWDTDSCIPIQRKSSHSLRSFLSGFNDEADDVVPGLGALDSGDNHSLYDHNNSSSTSTFDGISSLLSSCSTPSWSLRKRQKRLRWGKVEMRFYPVMPGDHPDTAHGPPLTIGWDHFATISLDIDTYESSKTRPGRQGDKLRLSWLTRRRILARVGATEDDIYNAVESSHQTKKQRTQTLSSWHRRQVALEIAFSAIRWTRAVFRHANAAGA